MALQTPDGSCSYAELLTASQAGAVELHDRGAVSGTKVAIALPAGIAFAQALHACMLLGAIAVPIDLRLAAHERTEIIAATEMLVSEPLGGETRRAHGTPLSHDLDAPAVIIHTSGTTSSPRPVSLSYGNLLWSALAGAVALGSDPSDRWLCALPLSHVGGLSILIRSAVHSTTAVVHSKFNVDQVAQALAEEQISMVSLVSTTLSRLLDAGLRDPPSLRCALTGGGPVSEALLQRSLAAGVPVSQTYGLTEACSQVCTVPIAAIGAGRASGAGVPLFCTRVHVAPDGEILLAGPTVAAGSREEDGWLHTGDLGALDQSGNLHVLGRLAETIVSGGENVAPAEVESVLESHPSVLEVGVVAMASEEWGESVHAIVVAREGLQIDGEALGEYCVGRVAPFKIPKKFTFVDGPLPRTASGKLLRRELR